MKEKLDEIKIINATDLQTFLKSIPCEQNTVCKSSGL